MPGFLYLVHIDELLQLLVDSNCGVEVCSIACGNPLICDDLTVLALFPSLLQIMLNISYDYSLKWHFKFQSNTSCVVLYSKQNARSDTVFMLGDQPLKNEKFATHLGIRHDAKLKSKIRTEECCQKGFDSFYAMLGYGVNPTGLKSHNMHQTLQKNRSPYYCYGCEIWYHLSVAEVDKINRTQRRIVKNIQGFSLRTRTDICESMLGLHPFSSEIDKRKLMFLHKIMSLPKDNISSQIFFRRLFLFIKSENLVVSGFISDIRVCRVLCRYNLQTILNTFNNDSRFIGKYVWRNTVCKAISDREDDAWHIRESNDNETVAHLC